MNVTKDTPLTRYKCSIVVSFPLKALIFYALEADFCKSRCTYIYVLTFRVQNTVSVIFLSVLIFIYVRLVVTYQ